MQSRNLLIGLDIGTTSIQAVLLTASGEQLAAFAAPVKMVRRAPGLAEQDPRRWMDGVLAALNRFSVDRNLSGLAGIGICSQANTHVFVGPDGTALMPAITWQDIRCAEDAAELDARASLAQKTSWFSSPVSIDASHALARIAHVAKAAPAIYARTRNVLLPKDYCVMQLTGAIHSDAGASVGLVGKDGRYVHKLLELVPGSEELLPTLRPFEYVAGRVHAGLPCAGTPVVVGTMDAWAGMYGVGAISEGDAMYQAGTSEILGILSSSVNATAGVIVFPPHGGLMIHAAPTQSDGASLDWFSGVLGITTHQASKLAAQSSGSAVPLFLPHLQGEQAPVWDTKSRGVFARIDSRTSASEMMLSVMEGVALSARWAFEELQNSSAVRVSSASIGGGGSRSDLWCQIRADVLNCVLKRAVITEAAAVGAAILAGVGCSLLSSAAEAVERLVHFDRSFEPDAATRGYYNDRYAQYRELYEALRPLNASFLPDLKERSSSAPAPAAPLTRSCFVSS